MNPPTEIHTDIAVVGSGPGGAVTACVLAEGGREVTLIESGDLLTLGDVEPFTLEEMVQKYRYGGVTAALGSPKVAYVEGNCVGGGSEINAGLYHRTPANVLAEWRDHCALRDSSFDDLLPHFKACEQDLSVQLLDAGVPAASTKLKEGANQLGWESIEVPRWIKQVEGTLVKQSMSETYIPRGIAAGLKLLPNIQVEKILRHRSGWRLCTRTADIIAQTVFLSAGAIQSPYILRNSGLRMNVGNSLHMHSTIKVVARFDEEINESTGVPVHQIKEFAPRLSFGGSISTPPYLATTLLDHPTALVRVREEWRTMAVYYAMIRGGVGKVRGLPFYDAPLVSFRLSKNDLFDLTDGLVKLCEVLFAAGAVELYPTVRGIAPLKCVEDLEKIPRILPANRLNLMTIHLFGSCPAGERTERCAVDSFGRVSHANNLYVADASLLGGAPGVNPQGSIMAMVRRNACKFLDAG